MPAAERRRERRRQRRRQGQGRRSLASSSLSVHEFRPRRSSCWPKSQFPSVAPRGKAASSRVASPGATGSIAITALAPAPAAPPKLMLIPGTIASPAAPAGERCAVGISAAGAPPASPPPASPPSLPPAAPAALSTMAAGSAPPAAAAVAATAAATVRCAAVSRTTAGGSDSRGTCRRAPGRLKVRAREGRGKGPGSVLGASAATSGR